MNIANQAQHLFFLAIPVACIAWTVTHEQLFAELNQVCVDKSKKSKTLAAKKFFYLFTCEYCFSHYISAFFLIITGFRLFFDDWRGYLISGFSLVWVANFYMTIFGLLRQGLKKERIEATLKEEELKEIKEEKTLST